jgi:acetyl esterase/lipase
MLLTRNSLPTLVFTLGLLLLPATLLRAQSQAGIHLVIPLYPGVAPGSENWKQQERQTEVSDSHDSKFITITNVVQPTLTVFRPDPAKTNGTAVVVCPGGAYALLAWDYEGVDVARWLAERGITAFVLKYRLMETPDNPAKLESFFANTFKRVPGDFESTMRPAEVVRQLAIEDGRQAIRLIRGRAAEFGINPDHIGIMGFSAGGGLTMGVADRYDAQSKPNFAAPIYGLDFDRDPLPPDAPSLFIVATQGDASVPIEQSIRIFQRWTEAHHPAELHIYEKGSHGFGMRHFDLPLDHWPEDFERWLDSQGLLGSTHTAH